MRISIKTAKFLFRHGRYALVAMLLAGAEISSAEPQHPYILFTAEDIPSIKRAISQPGPRKNAFDKLSSSVSWNRSEAGKSGDPGWNYRIRFANALEETAVRHSISGDAQAGQSAKKALLDFLAGEDPGSSMYPWGFSVHSGQVASVLGVAFDCLYNVMSESERTAAIQKLNNWYGKTPNTTIWRNWEVAGVAGGAVLGLAIHYGPQRSARSDLKTSLESRFERIRTRGWNDLWNPGGSNDEGIGYSYYGYHILFRAAAAYRNCGYPEFFRTSNAAHAMNWYTRSWMHQIGRHDGYTDSHKLDGKHLPPEALFGARDLKDRLGTWGWTAIRGISGIGNVDAGGPTSPYIGVALWFPDDLASGHPQDAGIPSSGLTGCTLDESGKDVMPGSGGIYWLKNGLGDREKLHVTYHVTDETPNHSHFDATHLTIAAHGVLWCDDTPYGATGFADHNVMQVNGKDQRKDGAVNSGRMRGRLGHRVFGSFGDIAHGDFSAFFGVQRADRLVMLLKGPIPYALVYDEAANGTASVELKSHFNSDKSWSGSGTTADPARLSSSGKSLEISVLSGDGESCAITPNVAYRTFTDANITRHRVVLRSSKPDNKRLTLVNPRNGSPRPVVAEINVAGGRAATLDWGASSDVVAFGGGGSLTAGKLATDGRAALVRLQDGKVGGFLLGGGKTLSYEGSTLIQFDASASVSSSGTQADVEAPEGSQGRIYGPTVSTLRVNGVDRKIVRDGNFVVISGAGGPTAILGPPYGSTDKARHQVRPDGRWYDLRGRAVGTSVTQGRDGRTNSIGVSQWLKN